MSISMFTNDPGIHKVRDKAYRVKDPKQKPPNKIQSLKFGCEKFEIWLTGDRKTISIGVSRVEEGFTHDDGFCKINYDFRLKLEKETITIGTESHRHYSILITDCEYSFWQLCDYFKDLCSEYKGEENEKV